MTTGTGQALYEEARTLIPGGTQLLSKRPEMFLPGAWPAYYSSAQGCTVTDLDGNQYVDMSHNGIGACVLGHHDPDVDGAVHRAIDAGTMATLNCPEEVELANLLVSAHPWADEVRYARTGGEAMAIAVRIARASTGRDKVAFCGYHGWHDWYLAANLGKDALGDHLLTGLSAAGVPRGLQGTALPFQYNDLDGLRAILEADPEVGVVVMEPVRSTMPDEGFLAGVRRLCDEHGAVMILDEITAGFRLNAGGAHLTLGVEPDIAVFAKAMSNGYPMAAVIGRSHVMDAAQTTFISSTYWTERIGPTAALATIRKHTTSNVHEHIIGIGQSVKAIWRAAAQEHDVPIHVNGLDPLAHFGLEGPDAVAGETLFTKIMLGNGFLANGSFYATYAHQPEHLEAYGEAVDEAFRELAKALRTGTLATLIDEPHHTGFRRLA